MVVDEIKRWIAERRLRPGDKLPKEAALQQLFGVSKGTAREALKSLEVQGAGHRQQGPAGGATISEVPLERTFQACAPRSRRCALADAHRARLDA
jgi:GntR family transcriptional regulator, transcriptional repressor for pyruvate dehydrogenase complex